MIEWSKGAEEQLFEILFSFKTTATLEPIISVHGMHPMKPSYSPSNNRQSH
jgi:hypothetical protein